MFGFKVNPIFYPNPAANCCQNYIDPTANCCSDPGYNPTANCCSDPGYNPTANCCNMNGAERYDYLLSQTMQACCDLRQPINENDAFQKAADDFFAYRDKMVEDKKAEEAQREHSDVAGEYKIVYVQEDD